MYITNQGDTWDKIAYNVYGNELYADKLILANIKYVGFFIFPEGIVLSVPEVEDEVEENVPEWRDDK